MTRHIPLDIQSQIMKRLPVKSLLRLHPVSKQWKFFTDDPKFIKNYHINHTNPQHHLLVEYELDTVKTYTTIIDNNTFPKQKFFLTAPESLHLLSGTFTLGSVYGLLCIYGFYGEVHSEARMAVIWNPAIKKSVGIVVIPKEGYKRTVVGFGVCPNTSDLKLVKINVAKLPNMWEVEVFTLSTRVWKTLYTGTPFKSCDLSWSQAFVDGVIYFLAYDDVFLNHGSLFNLVISFDLKSEKFGEVCLPGIGVWSRKDGANNQFIKIYTIKIESKWLYNWVLGFRNNGEAILDLYKESRIAVYEPLSRHINNVGINAQLCSTLYAWSYTETLLLHDESHSIIHQKG